MPGATYSNLYWDFPVDPAVNNFTLAATSTGFAVLNLNELGTPPASSYPSSADLTVANNASALHQVIAAMSTSYPRALLFGHSFGSIIAVTENITYHDPAVRGLTLQGFLHTEYAPGITRVLASLEPAQDDPGLAGYGLPAGYLTTVPADREADFGAAGDESAAVAAEDEATEVATSGSLLAGQGPAESPALTQAVTVPVNLVVGQHDNLFCGPSGCPTSAAVYAAEKSDYGPAAHLTVFVLPGAGHSVNLAEDAPLATAQELLWAAAAL